MDNLSNMLFELIKYDMNQIQRYRETILKLSITCIAASFVISGFLYANEYSFSIGTRMGILLGTHISLIVIIAIIAYYYVIGLKASRASCDLREIALKKYISNQTINFNSLYPDTNGYEPDMKLHLEKFAIYLSIGIIIIKTIVECLLMPYL